MKSNLARDIGENTEYIKEIISNTIELKKIEALESGIKIGSRLALFISLAFLVLIIGLLLTAVIIIGLFQYTESYLTAILITIGILLIKSLMLYLLRHKLFTRPISKVVSQIILK